MSKKLAFVWLGIAALFRVIPHIPNFSPLMSSALFAGAKMNRKTALLSLLVMMVITDVALSFVHNTSIFGWWTLFTFSGVLSVAFIGSKLKENFTGVRFLGCSLGGAILFWTWTNFGTWLTAGIYPMNGAGLIACYAAAIPFLQSSLLGDLIWSGTLYASYEFIVKSSYLKSYSADAQEA